MKILLDRCVPKRFTKEISSEHVSIHASDLEWGAETNGNLVRIASEEGFEVLLTVDKNMPSQTNLKGLSLGGLVLDIPDNTLETLRLASEDIHAAFAQVEPGEYLIIKTGPWR